MTRDTQSPSGAALFFTVTVE